MERKLPDVDLAIAPLGDPVIASLFVDDAMPGLNPMRLHQPHWGHRSEIPNVVLDEFADVVEREGLAGKFSVVPYPLGLGRIDQAIPGVSDAVVREFVRTVRERIAGPFDITPELLTHGPAIDPVTGYVCHLTEKEWGSTASALEWASYLRNAYTLLHNVGLEPGGCTSPWDTGADNEDAYALGIAAASAAMGLDVAFYFVHMATEPREGLPEVRVWRRGADGVPSRAVVSLRCSAHDALWPTQFGGPPRTDDLIGPEGEGGVLPRFGDSGAPVVVVTHWQSLFGNGARRGPEALGALAQRLRQRYGARLAWWSASRTARFAAAAHALGVEAVDGQVALDAPLDLQDAMIRVAPAPGRRLALAEGGRLDTALAPDGSVTIRGDVPAGRAVVARLAESGRSGR